MRKKPDFQPEKLSFPDPKLSERFIENNSGCNWKQQSIAKVLFGKRSREPLSFVSKFLRFKENLQIFVNNSCSNWKQLSMIGVLVENRLEFQPKRLNFFDPKLIEKFLENNSRFNW